MEEVSFEVLVLQGGKWTIDSLYSNLEREMAIADARSMHENPHVVAVKVIKETYDSDTGGTYESTVFSTEAAKPAIGEKASFADMEVTVGGPSFADMSIGENGFVSDEKVVRPKKKNQRANRRTRPGKIPLR